uniref:Uncharacterized protein n=1 Tax=Sphaerodactylus townsendi TaxID=933632 RepID=A0ACB8F2H6_9SAUR
MSSATGTYELQDPINYRGGTRVQPADGNHQEEVYEPSTGRVIGKFLCSGEKEVDLAVQSAHAAFRIWSQKSGMERSTILLEAARLIQVLEMKQGKSLFLLPQRCLV